MSTTEFKATRTTEIQAEIARVTRMYASKPALRRVIVQALQIELSQVSQ